MTRFLAGAAAFGVAALLSLSAANAAPQQRADGMRNAESIEVSAQRRHHHHRHHSRHHHYGPRYGHHHYYGPRHHRPHYGHSYGYHRPYYRHHHYRSGPHVGFGFGY